MSKSNYYIGCLCTEGEGTILGRVFPIEVHLDSNTSCFKVLQDIINIVQPAFPNLNLPSSALNSGYKLWKLVHPLSPEDLETKSAAVKKATTLQSLDKSSESHEPLEGLRIISRFLIPEELERYREHVHLILQVPKCKTRRSTRSKLCIFLFMWSRWYWLGKTDNLVQNLAFKNLAKLIAIKVSQNHKVGSDFGHEHLSEPGDTNNDVSPATSGNGDNSALVSKVGHVYKLATAIMQGTLKMRPWPVCLLSSTQSQPYSHPSVGNRYPRLRAWRAQEWIFRRILESSFQDPHEPSANSWGWRLCVVSFILCRPMDMGLRFSHWVHSACRTHLRSWT